MVFGQGNEERKKQAIRANLSEAFLYWRQKPQQAHSSAMQAATDALAIPLPAAAALGFLIAGCALAQDRQPPHPLWSRARQVCQEAGLQKADAAIATLEARRIPRSHSHNWLLTVHETIATVALTADCLVVAAEALRLTGVARRDRGDYPAALRDFTTAQSCYLKTSEPEKADTLLLAFASVHRLCGEWEQAEQYITRAEENARRGGSPEDIPRVLYARGEMLWGQGRLREARELLQKAQTLWKPLPRSGLRVADCQRLLGSICREQGEVTSAFSLLFNALARFEHLHSTGHIGQTYLEIGLLYAQLGQTGKRKRCIEHATNAAKDMQGSLLRYTILQHSAEMAFTQREYPLALQLLQEARTGLSALPAPRPAARATLLMAEVYALTGQKSHFAQALEDGLKEAHQVNDLVMTRKLHLLAAEEKAKNQQWKEALLAYDAALVQVRQQGSLPDEARVLSNMAVAHIALGNRKEAGTYFQQTISIVKSLHTNASANSPEIALELSGTLNQWLSPYVRFLLQEKRYPDAFAIVQLMKARALREQIARSGVSETAIPAPNASLPQEPSKEQRLREKAVAGNRQLMALQAMGVPANDPRVVKARTTFLQAEQELAQYLDRVAARHPETASRQGARIPETRQILACLSAKEALIEFVSLSDTKIAVIAARRSVSQQINWQGAILAVPPLAQAIRAFQTACNSDQNWYQAGQALSTLLFAKTGLRTFLADTSRLYICPTGPLWNVPFGALPLSGDTPLFEMHEVVLNYAGSLLPTFLSSNPKKPLTPLAKAVLPRKRSALVIAVSDFSALRQGSVSAIPALPSFISAQEGALPDLPNTLTEAQTVAAACPGSQLLLQHQATHTAVLKQMGKHPIVHFATHAQLNDVAPLYSSLALYPQAKDGNPAGPFLTARDLMTCDLSLVETTVLSTCRSGGGTAIAGEGIVGFAWALLAAGCSSLVAAPWPVEDHATAVWMRHFYKARSAGKSRAAAARTAALATRREHAAFANPRHYASFQLIGAP